MASLHYYEVRNALEAWQETGAVKTLNELSSAKQASDAARKLHGSNPLYIELAGQIIEWEVIAGYNNLQALERAKNYYIESSKYRPLWPVTYANLAMIKWRMQEFDDEMLEYVLKADRLGSQNVEVHIFITRLGISLYQANHPMYTTLKDRIHARISAGMRHQLAKPSIINYIKQNNALESVCRWMKPVDTNMATNDLGCQ